MYTLTLETGHISAPQVTISVHDNSPFNATPIASVTVNSGQSVVLPFVSQSTSTAIVVTRPMGWNTRSFTIDSVVITNSYYVADIISAQDYYPYGSLMPGRQVSTNAYRFGYNGKEKDDETKGTGNEYYYGYRSYDPRISRFFSMDPVGIIFANRTPYSYAENNPVFLKDFEGLFGIRFDVRVTADQQRAFTELVNNLESFVRKSPQLLTELTRQTGYTQQQILALLSSNNSDITLVVTNMSQDHGPTMANAQDVSIGQIRISHNIIQQLEFHVNQRNTDPANQAAMALITVSEILAHFTIFVDRSQNNGWLTGKLGAQTSMMENSSPGVQGNIPLAGSRDEQVRQAIFQRQVSWEKFRGYYWTNPSRGHGFGQQVDLVFDLARDINKLGNGFMAGLLPGFLKININPPTRYRSVRFL